MSEISIIEPSFSPQHEDLISSRQRRLREVMRRRGIAAVLTADPITLFMVAVSAI